MAECYSQHSELGATSYVIAGDRGTAVVDPGWYPREIAALQRRVTSTAAGRATHVVLTHGHPDHVAGWAAFPGATLIAEPSLLGANDWPRARAMIEGQYVRAGVTVADRFAPPPTSALTPPPASLDLGGVSLRFVAAPFHSQDSLLIAAPELRIIIGGDHLTAESGWPPVIRTTLDDCLRGISEAAAVCDVFGCDRWLPGHGPEFRSRAELDARLAVDRDYLMRLSAAVFAAKVAGFTAPEIESRLAVFHHADDRIAGKAVPLHLANIRALYSQ